MHEHVCFLKQHPANKDKLRSDFDTLMNMSFRTRCLEQDPE